MQGAPDLSTALIFEGGHLLSQTHQRLAEEIAHRYRNIRLVFIPESERVHESEKKYPFGIVDIDSGRLIRRFEENGDQGVMHALRWLWENDSQRVDTLAKFEAENAAIKAAKEAEEKARFEGVADLAAHVIRSPLHTYKHNGVKISDGYRAGQGDLLKEYRDAR